MLRQVRLVELESQISVADRKLKIERKSSFGSTESGSGRLVESGFELVISGGFILMFYLI